MLLRNQLRNRSLWLDSRQSVNWGHSLNAGIVGWWMWNPIYTPNPDTWNDLTKRFVANGVSQALTSTSSVSHPGQMIPTRRMRENGASDYWEVVNSADDSRLEGFSEFTISFWVRFVSHNANTHPLVIKGDQAANKQYRIHPPQSENAFEYPLLWFDSLFFEPDRTCYKIDYPIWIISFVNSIKQICRKVVADS